jgi:hypothetical protein
MPHSPAVPATPERGARMPILSGAFCAIAGLKIPGAAAATSPEPASFPNERRVSFMIFPPMSLFYIIIFIQRILLPYLRYITDVIASVF